MNLTFTKSVSATALIVALILTAQATLQQTEQSSVEGTYEAEVTAEGQGTTPFILIIKREGEKLTAESKGGGDITVSGIKVEGESVVLSAAWQGNSFELPGKLTEGGMGGKWEAGGFGGTWSAKKSAAK